MNDRPDDSSQQPAPSPDRNGFSWLAWLSGFVQRTFIMLAIYVLSIGPLYWQWYGGRFAGGSAWLAAFYEPLRIASERIPPFGNWMNWYVNLWIG